MFLFQQETAEALCVKDKKANLRSGPGKQNEKLWTVLKYMPFRQVGREGDWLKVKDLDGDVGNSARAIERGSKIRAVDLVCDEAEKKSGKRTVM